MRSLMGRRHQTRIGVKSKAANMTVERRAWPACALGTRSIGVALNDGTAIATSA